MNASTQIEQTPAQQAQAQRAAVAVGVAPMGVLLGFTAVVSGFIEADTALAVFATCTAWVVYELYRYQRLIGQAED